MSDIERQQVTDSPRSTGIHRGDREYQQDQVAILAHGRVPGCVHGHRRRRHGRQQRRPQGLRPGDAHGPAAVRALLARPRRRGRPAQADRAGSAPRHQADRHLRRAGAAQHARRLHHQPRRRLPLGPRRRLAHLPLPRRRAGQAHHGPFVRAAPGRRRRAHRGRSQRPSAVEHPDGLPGPHEDPPPTMHHIDAARARRRAMCLQRRRVALLHAEASSALVLRRCRRARPASS